MVKKSNPSMIFMKINVIFAKVIYNIFSKWELNQKYHFSANEFNYTHIQCKSWFITVHLYIHAQNTNCDRNAVHSHTHIQCNSWLQYCSLIYVYKMQIMIIVLFPYIRIYYANYNYSTVHLRRHIQCKSLLQYCSLT